MKRLAQFSAALAVLALTTSSCGAGVASTPLSTIPPSAGPSTTIPATLPTTTVPSTTEAPRSNLGGDRLPVQVPGEAYGHYPTMLTGVVDLETNGCWTIDLGDGPHLVVLPAGYVIADTGVNWRGPDGTVIEAGMAVDALGGLAPVANFPGIPDGFWGNYRAFCGDTDDVVVVLDSVEPAFDPKALSDEALVDMLRNADLSVSWGCGLGFTVSTRDQRVALVMYSANAEAVIDPPISFPDPGWRAMVMVGKNLLANHCDDVFESWEPVPSVARQWDLTAGTLTFTPPPGGPCSGGGPVEADPGRRQVTTVAGEIAIPELSMTNDAYGCFAG